MAKTLTGYPAPRKPARKTIESTVYHYNFFVMNGEPTPGFSMKFPRGVRPSLAALTAETNGNEFTCKINYDARLRTEDETHGYCASLRGGCLGPIGA